MITKACHDEWEVDVGEPQHMLGVTIEISYDKETGVGKNHLTLTGFVEKLRAKFGHHRNGKKVHHLSQGERCSPLGEDGTPMIQATMIGKNYTSRTTGSMYVCEEDELSSLRADIRYPPRALQRTST
jgi:hypothetical protein